jgi:hypothetical protein
MGDPRMRGFAVPVRTLVGRMLTAIGVIGLLYGVGIVMLFTPEDPALSTRTPFTVAAATTGLAGLAVVALWRSRVLVAPVSPRRYLIWTVLMAGVGEVGYLVGATGYVINGDTLAIAIGAVLFIFSILILSSTVGSVEFTEQ